jgi:precorrin-6B methylase 2
MSLKELGKSFVGRTAKYPAAFAVYKFSGRVAERLGQIYGHARHTLEVGERDERLRKLASELFPDPVVASGPFAGMKWTSHPFGGALLPRLLGSYEAELHPALEEAFKQNYSTIVDIGCAEGYYAIGMARRFPHAIVYAFDTNPHARRFCSRLAELNGVQDRVRIGESCDPSVLASLPLGERALIICDCEGYEKVLFNRTMADRLAKHDLIVEIHDFKDLEISTKVRDAFLETHSVHSIKSIDDIQKAHTYQYPRLDRYDIKTKCLVVSERRTGIMEWFVITSKLASRELLAAS